MGLLYLHLPELYYCNFSLINSFLAFNIFEVNFILDIPLYSRLPEGGEHSPKHVTEII
jgi:hypothetical protein